MKTVQEWLRSKDEKDIIKAYKEEYALRVRDDVLHEIIIDE